MTVFLFAGVEHLLRDVRDATISTLATDVSDKLLVRAGPILLPLNTSVGLEGSWKT